MVEHWVETVAKKVEKEFGYKELIIGNGGLSVSGLQHVGRLRGEITLVDAVLQELKKKGYDVKHTLVLYTVDPWKGKETQLGQFEDKEEAKQYVGRPLYRVPDPYRCHENWVKHYWEDFGEYLENFSHEIQIITTQELYEENQRMYNFILDVIKKRDEVIETLNKYRKRKPYPKTYIPFEPICQRCGRIDTTEVLSVNFSKGTVDYTCNNCGFKGTQSLRKGKLNWRLEWVGVWKAMDVSFEPYGKDHATPGGSRDSCKDLAENIFGFKSPVGLPYEWVGYETNGKDMGDMGSSDFIGFTPKDWVEVAEGEVLRYLYLVNQPMKRIVLNLKKVPIYTEQFDRAERIYYGLEKTKLDKSTLEIIKKSYLYALLEKPSDKPLFQLPYLHAVAMIQILPAGGDIIEEAIRRLQITKYIDHSPNEDEVKRIERRLTLAKNWLMKYADDRYKIRVIDSIPKDVKNIIPKQVVNKLKELYEKLQAIEWTEENIKKAMIEVEKDGIEKEFFAAIYFIFFGREYGPRIAPYFAIMDRKFVLERFRELFELTDSKA
ncbi:MAG: lysine--tRNA ligase [Thermoprotei archaeon]|nr:MAG: lysine--tRNA ligase [Thermoprotei archaeon]